MTQDVKSIALSEDGSWVFDPEAGAIKRGDGRFFRMEVKTHPGGYPAGVLVEEPNSEKQTEDGKRIIGQVIVTVNSYGSILARTAKGWNGDVWELQPSSLSKGEVTETLGQHMTYIESNPQRIEGVIEYVLVRSEDAGNGMFVSVSDFLKRSTDGRSLAAVAKFLVEGVLSL